MQCNCIVTKQWRFMVAQTYIVVGNKACERLKLGEHGWGLDRSPARHCVESRDELTTIANWRDRSGARRKRYSPLERT